MINRSRPMLKPFLKTSIRAACAALGRQNWPGDQGLLVLMYHRILPREDERIQYIQPGMYVSKETFAQHLKILKSRFDVVALGEWLANPNSVAGSRKCCAITFDDGWYDNYEHAFPLLHKENLPATIFSVTNYIGSYDCFWPERLAAYLWNHGKTLQKSVVESEEFAWIRSMNTDVDFSCSLGRDSIDKIITTAKSATEQFIYEHLDRLEYKYPQEDTRKRELMTWDNLREMHSGGLISIGSHTVNHTRLNAAADTAVVEYELTESQRVLEKEIGQKVDLFCYPNGDFTPAAEQLVKKYYRAACTTVRGWHAGNADRYRIKRIGMHEDISNTKTRFLARLSGWC